jgi:signal transduction histidine kinase
MHRPWQIGVVFIACLAVVLAALGWASYQVLRLDRLESEARVQAVREENVRLALWRMETALAPLVAQESARPYFEYSAFYPAERAYTRMFNRLTKADVLLPSPLLVQPSPHVLIHFQIGPDGAVTSPQVPDADMRRTAESGYTDSAAIDAAAARLADLQSHVAPARLTAMLPPPEERPPTQVQLAQAQAAQAVEMPAQTEQPPQGKVQAFRNEKEYQARAQTQAVNLAANIDNAAQNFVRQNYLGQSPVAEVREGVMKPVWLGDALMLARRVSVGGREYVQGAWLDWPAVRKWLLESVKDLVPQAELVPASAQPARHGPPLSALERTLASFSRSSYAPPEDPGRLLAAVPVRLVPGAVPAPSVAWPSPLLLSLIVAWICVLVAGAAVAALLWGTVALSERRAAFVSAVTHELRTPLTTFRMYSEMLAGGMVTDEAKRLRYLDTLRRESERLVHLVENVLSYARLERGRARGRTETVRLADLAGRIGPRLAERAEQAGFQFVIENSADATVRADPSAVEQILFNLVDNACKYAAGAADNRIHLVAEAAGGRAVLKVCDHGPGISARDARRLFRPFSKSARDAANSAPGVGLGLALSRRLAREMGGDLTLIARPGDGACFALSLPQG